MSSQKNTTKFADNEKTTGKIKRIFRRNFGGIAPVVPRKQLKKLAKELDCTPEVANRKVRVALSYGLTVEYCLENGLFELSARNLDRYLSHSKPRMYVEEIARKEGARDIDVYRQIKRAAREFGVPYHYFAIRNLYGASDKVLARYKRRKEAKNQKNIEKIALVSGMSFEEAQKWTDHMRKKYDVGPRYCLKHRLFEKSDEEIVYLLEQERFAIEKRRERAMRESGWDEERLLSHIAFCMNQYGIGANYYYSLKCYELSNEQLSNWTPWSDMIQLSKKYNRNTVQIDHKDQFCNLFKDSLGRKFWINQDTNFDDFKAFTQGLDAIFCKPIDGTHGKGSHKEYLANWDLSELYDSLMKEPALVAEEIIVQHPAMAAFNSTSVNTIRLCTIFDGKTFDAFNAYVRFGNGGVVDNYSSGGIECGVDPQTGIVTTRGICKTGEFYDTHPISGLRFEGFQIPHWDKVLARAERAMRSVKGVGFVGWDIAICPEDVVLVEGNTGPGPGAYQRFLIERGESLKPRYQKYLP